MAFSKITVVFNSNPQLNDVVSIGNSLSATDLFETFKLERFQSFQTTIGVSDSDSAFNYLNALTLDYNGSNLYGILYELNQSNIPTIVITAKQEGVVFTEVTNTSNGRITTVIDNQPASPRITIDDISFSQSDTDACANIKATVTTSELATKVTSPILIDPNSDNPFDLDVLRGTTVLVTCESATGIASQSVQTPAVLSIATTQVNIVSNPNGGDVNITHDSSYLLTLEYSLNNVDWQTSNSFSGLGEGNYTVYVRDQFGCSIAINFAITIFTPDISVTVPFDYVAKELSVRFKKNETWDFCSIYRNEENTLSCEEKVETAYPYIHKFQTCDNIKLQFLSNYETLSANVIKEDETKDALNIVKVSNNLGAEDKRDARYYNLENGQTGVYYVSGNTYDYSTGSVTGTYELYGELPVYGAIGNYIFLDGIGWKQIIDIITDDDKDADVLVIENTYEGAEQSIIVSSTYNIRNYEVYEFSVDMSTYDGQQIQVEILMSDSSFGQSNYLSEKIEVTERWYDTLEVIWYNTQNTFVFYETGLKNKARLDFQYFNAGDESGLEIHKTDNTTLMISSNSYETMNLELDTVSTGIKRQLTKAFLHKELYIDGIKYVLNSEPESEPINFTNQHVLRFNLIKTGDVFNSEFDGSGNVLEGLEVIGILQNNGQYIKL